MYLNTHSFYSLRYGTLSIEKIIEQAKLNGVKSLILTDINNSTGIFDFVKECNKNNIQPIAGMEFRENDKFQFVAIAQNNDGFHEINKFRSYLNINNLKCPEKAPEFKNVNIIYPFGKLKNNNLHDYEFVGIRPYEINKLLKSEYISDQSKLVILQPVTFTDEIDFMLHKNLRAVNKNSVFGKMTADDFASPTEIMQPYDKLLADYQYYPQIIRNTEKIIENCSFDFDFKQIKNKKTFTGNRNDDKLLLEKLAIEGLTYRYGNPDKAKHERLHKELEIIDKLSFSAYFLITWDIIRYSMSRGIYHVGRGSGANSLVAYCLKITDVDPIELNLYFERFLNPKRTSPPDFDIDYSWKDRDDVQDYIFKRYGYEHVALLGTMSTFKDKSIYRELGKVYGLPKEEIDSFLDNPSNAQNISELTLKITKIAQKLEDFPNLRSIHAGGILISELPITYYTALDMPPKGFQTTQFDMYISESIGFEKLDILSQRGIGHIFEAKQIIEKNQGISVDVHQVEKFKHDEDCKRLISNGETNGCFYIESPAMRGLLKKLRCDNYISLVAASSIIRPGVAQSGMMREYIKRFHNPNSFKYLHPIFEEQLGETYGVMVFQEDVLKICHHFAGLDLDEADILRRIMSGKPRFKHEFDAIVNRFFGNCKERGYSDELANEVWRQLSSFAGYSFSKAHSASYAVESYQSLYLKAHFPKEFMVAVINNFGGFYRTWVYFNEAKRWGAVINLPCVNKSDFKTNISGNDVFIGFIHIANLEQRASIQIIEERKRNGNFVSLVDFINRISIGIEQIIILIRIGALRFTEKSKAQLLWEAHQLLRKSKNTEETKALFGIEEQNFELPVLQQTKVEDAYDEIELLGFPVTLSFFDLLQTNFRGEILAFDLKNKIGNEVRMVGHLATYKYVFTTKKEIMHFGTFLDFKGEFFDTVHFPQSLKNYPFQGNGVYLLKGKVVQEFDFPSIEIEKMAKLPLKSDPRYRK